MRPQLVGLGFALTGNLQVASDLAQEALLRSWVHWEKIRTYQDPSAWARRVLRNLAANQRATFAAGAAAHTDRGRA